MSLTLVLSAVKNRARQSRLTRCVVTSSYVYHRGDRPVLINDLISPLRYDIAIRLEYFRFFADHQRLFSRNFRQYMALARRHPYFVWFTTILVPRYLPDLLRDESRLQSAFEQQVRRAADLHRLFLKRGFDTRSPVILHTGRVIQPTVTGKSLSRPLYAGDGCHRLALLKLNGTDQLSPAMYILRAFDHFTPYDNTHALLQSMAITREEYFAFLSLSYADRECYTAPALLREARARGLTTLREVTAVIARDRSHLSSTANPHAPPSLCS